MKRCVAERCVAMEEEKHEPAIAAVHAPAVEAPPAPENLQPAPEPESVPQEISQTHDSGNAKQKPAAPLEPAKEAEPIAAVESEPERIPEPVPKVEIAPPPVTAYFVPAQTNGQYRFATPKINVQRMAPRPSWISASYVCAARNSPADRSRQRRNNRPLPPRNKQTGCTNVSKPRQLNSPRPLKRQLPLSLLFQSNLCLLSNLSPLSNIHRACRGHYACRACESRTSLRE